MTEIRTKRGVVGFFDILGYVSFLDNNKTRVAAQIVLEVLLELKRDISGQLKTKIAAFQETTRVSMAEEVNSIVQSMGWRVFSDTILLTAAYDEGSDESEQALVWMAAILVTARLQRHLFDKGLPVRGALAYGEYFIEETCFAGKSIIDAYKEGQNIDLAAAVLSGSKSTRDELERLLESASDFRLNIDAACVDYLFPVRLGEPVRRRGIPYWPSFTREDDVRGSVIESFSKHRKDVGSGVVGKVNNTELFLHVTAAAGAARKAKSAGSAAE